MNYVHVWGRSKVEATYTAVELDTLPEKVQRRVMILNAAKDNNGLAYFPHGDRSESDAGDAYYNLYDF